MQWFVIAVSLTLLAGCSAQERNKTLAGKADMRLAEVAMANGMPQTALSVTREILESDPRNVAALLHQGDALVAMGQSDAAEECYRRAAEVDPQSVDALRGLGRVRLAMGQPKAAEAAFRTTIQRAPNDAAAFNNLGIALDLQERHDEAQAAYQEALTRRPAMTAAQVNLGLSLALGGATGRALDDSAATGERPGRGRQGASGPGRRADACRRCGRGRQGPRGRPATGQGVHRTGRLRRPEGVRQMNARSTSGAVAIEFALVGLVFISLLLLAMETAWQLVIDSALGAGARAASRFGSTGTVVAAGITPPPADRTTSIEDVLIQNSGGLLQAGRLQIAEASYASFRHPCRVAARAHQDRATRARWSSTPSPIPSPT